MNWLARLKKQQHSETDPTETTKRISVVSVGTPDRGFQNIESDSGAANDTAKPWRVTLAPGIPPETAAKFRAASLALDAQIEADRDPDRTARR